MSDNCFVCLDKTSNKICKNCNCYAHPKCWLKYLYKFAHSKLFVYSSDVIILNPFFIDCPQCKRLIEIKKPVTRKDTRIGRELELSRLYYNLIERIGNTDIFEEKIFLYKKLFNLTIKNKKMIPETILDIIKDKLIQLYNESNWKSANLYHMKIFNEQIK